MMKENEPVCDVCQPKLVPVVEGSSILVPICQCLGHARCSCPAELCQCWSCQRRGQHSSDHLEHRRQTSYDWRELDNEYLGNVRHQRSHSKFCECRGSVSSYFEDVSLFTLTKQSVHQRVLDANVFRSVNVCVCD